MPRLGSVIGGILAELARGRVIADKLTRELVGEYEKDPILAAMSVPRVSLSQASLRLRFTIDDLQEAEPPAIDVSKALVEWNSKLSSTVMKKVLQEVRAPEAQAESLVPFFEKAGATRAALGKALNGETSNFVADSVKRALTTWGRIDADTRRLIGGRRRLSEALTRTLTSELETFVETQNRNVLTTAALQSALSVGVISSQLPSDASQVHEIELQIQSDVLDTVVENPEG